MPELLTKYPDIVMKLLKEHEISCAEGAQQDILKECPASGFCSLKGGELCIYGLDQFSQMTQIKKEDICPSQEKTYIFGGYLLSFMAGFFIAFFIAYWFFKKK